MISPDCLCGPINTHKTIDLRSEIQHAQFLFFEATKQGSEKIKYPSPKLMKKQIKTKQKQQKTNN